MCSVISPSTFSRELEYSFSSSRNSVKFNCQNLNLSSLSSPDTVCPGARTEKSNLILSTHTIIQIIWVTGWNTEGHCVKVI